jgi:AraC-like DNA-binding protein
MRAAVSHTQRMLDVIQRSFADRVTLDTLAVTIDRQAAHLGRLFRQEVGMTVREFVTRARLHEATRLICSGVKIEAVSLTVGYRSKKNFYRQFKRRFAVTPEAYRQQFGKPADLVERDAPNPKRRGTTSRTVHHVLPVVIRAHDILPRQCAGAPFAILLTNEAGLYVGANEAAASMTGYPLLELAGLGPWDLFSTWPAVNTKSLLQIVLPASLGSKNALLLRKDGAPAAVQVLNGRNMLQGRPDMLWVLDERDPLQQPSLTTVSK